MRPRLLDDAAAGVGFALVEGADLVEFDLLVDEGLERWGGGLVAVVVTIVVMVVVVVMMGVVRRHLLSCVEWEWE